MAFHPPQTVAITISGRVTDQETGQGIPGVNVLVKGTAQGASTNVDGNYQINVPNASTTLVFSFVGYVTQEIVVGSQTTLNVTLASDSKSLGEVVVVGYGTQSKAKLIGSVAQIESDKINNRAVPQLSQSLTGQLPGVSIIQRSGQPGSSGGTIQIRGVGSFGAATNPLILVDGIPTNSFNDIDPNDVESVSVLKDASSAAIYGARAANGVILVTTKLGKSKKPRISYNGYVGVQRMTATPEIVNSAEYAQLMNEAVPGTYTDAQIQKFRDGSDPDNYPNSDFIGAVLKKQTLQTGHNISISNGGDNTQYLLSAGYLRQNGIVAKNDYTRYNLRLNLTNTLTQRLKLTTRLSAIQSVDHQPAAPPTLDFNDMVTAIGQVVRSAPVYPIRLSNGDWGTGLVNKGTPVSYLDNESSYTGKSTDLLGNMRLDWQVIDDLTLSVLGGYTQTTGRGTRFLATQRLNSAITLGPSSLNESTNTTTYRTLQAFADYRKTVGKHEISALAGYSFETSLIESLGLSRSNLPTNNITVINAGDASTQTTSGTADEWALESYFGRLQYNYDNKYLAEGTLRYDGSSRFPTDRKYAAFPSVAVGWRLGQEAFIKDRFTFIDELKLKASYGTLGNQNLLNTNGSANYYPYQNVLNTGYNYPFGGVITTGVARTTITDTTLHWESTRTKDIGLEASFFKRLISVSASYFHKKTYDILVSPSASVAKVLGFNVGQKNSGSLLNEGWEFTLQHQHKRGGFSYSIGGNLTYLKNTVLDLGVGNVTQPNGLVGNGSTLFIGYPSSLYYGYVADGLFVNQDDINTWANQTAIAPNPKPGDIRYKDISGPNGVPDGKVDANYDRTYLGSTIPKLNYGINLTAGFRGFDLSVLFQGVGGVGGSLSGYAGYAFYNTGNVQRWQADGRWTAANPDRNALYPRLELITNSGTNNTLTSSFWTLNGSYLRLKNVQLGYNVPKTLTQKLNLQSVRVYANAENLHLWSSYRKGWDPEINTGGAYYPILANYTFGLNLTF
ncbi:SusC/RagA family TonB-linked outer membrane protein [Larkinella arboricola]|nr:TonB-dependent receptor [Larkinella arboricola]